jgi:archaellin
LLVKNYLKHYQGTIDILNASVQLAAGSDPVNVSQASYTISSPAGNATVVNGNNNQNGAITHYQQQSLETGESTLTEQEDILLVEIDLDAQSGIEPLGDAETVSLIIQSPAGGQTFKQLKTPRNIETDSSYIL